MQRLKYINPMGAEVEFNSAAPYVFWKVTGLSLPPVHMSARLDTPGRSD